MIAGMWVFVHWMESAERASTAALRRTQVASALAILLVAPGLLFAGSLKAAAAEPATPSAGDARRGATLIAHYGCGYCHSIPGIDNAKGRVGPPLAGFGDRLYVAGMLPNTPENLAAWIEDPQRIVPGNVMPVLGVGDQDARDIAAYLQSLR